MVGSVTVHMVQKEGNSIIGNSTFTEATVITFLFQDGVGNDTLFQITNRVLGVLAFQDILHTVFAFLDIVRLGHSYPLLVLMYIE